MYEVLCSGGVMRDGTVDVVAVDATDRTDERRSSWAGKSLSGAGRFDNLLTGVGRAAETRESAADCRFGDDVGE